MKQCWIEYCTKIQTNRNTNVCKIQVQLESSSVSTLITKFRNIYAISCVSVECMQYTPMRRTISLKEGNAKRRNQKNWSVKELCGRCLSVWGQEPHTPPPPYTLYVYRIHIHSGKGGGGELNQREGWRGNSSKSWVTNSNMTDCTVYLQSINHDKHLPQSPFKVLFF